MTRLIEKHSERLTNLINDTMSLSRIEQEEGKNTPKERVKLINIIATSVDLCHDEAVKKDIAIEYSCNDYIELYANKQMLEQALVNLIDNAVKYSHSGDTVKINVDCGTDNVTISVIDHGCGIPEEHIPHLFERFYRVDKSRSRKNGGTGLGLAIVKHIAKLHNGTISVKSIPNTETTFTLKLPL